MKPLITIGKKWLEQPIEERNRIFKEALYGRYMAKYDEEMLDEFFIYWAYFEEGDQTMRFEEIKNKKFHIGRRLGTWSIGYKKKKSRLKAFNRGKRTIDMSNITNWTNKGDDSYDERL